MFAHWARNLVVGQSIKLMLPVFSTIFPSKKYLKRKNLSLENDTIFFFSIFSLFRFVLAYSLSHNIIEVAEIGPAESA